MGRVFLYTFNVAKYQADMNIMNKFKLAKPSTSKTQSDVFAVSIQEVPHAEISGVTTKYKTWLYFFTELMYQQKQTLIFHQYLLSNLIMIFGNTEFASFIQKIDNRYVRYTLGGTLGYKGTMGTRFHLRNGVDLVFITGHLTHAQENLGYRLKQYNQGKTCAFDDAKDVASKRVVFWFGDLNFRSTLKLTGGCLNLNEGRELHGKNPDADQLHLAMKSGAAFSEFEEPPVTFPPSYKFKIGTPNYDFGRVPSWCDRVLIKTKNLSYKNLCYDIDEEIFLSDHLPVYANYEIPDIFAKDHHHHVVPPLCKFMDIPTWTCSVYFMCQFHFTKKYFHKHGSNLDWIGFYKHPVRDFGAPEYWMYMWICYETTDAARAAMDDTNEIPEGSPKRYVAECNSLLAGQYVAAYFSVKYNCLIGMSNVFTVVTSINDS